MSLTTKIIAGLFVLVALLLGAFAIQLALRPAPPPPAPMAQTQAPAPDAAPARPPAPTYPVLVVSAPVEAGAVLTADKLSVAQWPVQPGGVETDPKAVEGRVLRKALAANEPVMSADVVRGLSTFLGQGERAVTIPVDELTGAQNRIRPGDMIDVFLMMDRSQEVPGTQTRLLQSRVRVLAYGPDSLAGPAEAQAQNTNNNAPVAVRNAILAVPVERVNELLLAARAGKLQLVLRSPEDESMPDPSLFPRRAPVLTARSGLTPAQQASARDGINAAFAGDALPQLAGPQPTPEAPPRAPRQGGGRSVEIIRGGEISTVNY